MSAAPTNFRLLGAIPEPSVFSPDSQWIENGRMYRLDSSRLICQSKPMGWLEPGRYNYFRASLGATKRRHRSESLGFVGIASRHRRLRSSKVLTWLFATTAVIAAVLIVYPYIPAAEYTAARVLPHRDAVQAAAASEVSPVNRLIIPKIGVSADILEAPTLDVLNTTEGVWHQTGGVVGGNLVLAGHRWKYLPPNNTTFYNLGKLSIGDTAIVDWDHRRYVYVVKSVSVIPATKTDILKPSTLPQLTMYTCNDKHQTQRISVVAEALP